MRARQRWLRLGLLLRLCTPRARARGCWCKQGVANGGNGSAAGYDSGEAGGSVVQSAGSGSGSNRKAQGNGSRGWDSGLRIKLGEESKKYKK